MSKNTESRNHLLSFRVSERMYTLLDEVAKKNKMSMNLLLATIVDEFEDDLQQMK